MVIKGEKHQINEINKCGISYWDVFLFCKIKMIGMLLNVVHGHVDESLQKRSLTGFITTPLY